MDGQHSSGSLRFSCLLTGGTFWVLPLTCFYFISPKVPGHTSFPNLSKFGASAAAPLVLTTFVRNRIIIM